MTFSDIAYVVRRWWWLLALGPVAGAAIALGLTARMDPVYRATATLLIAHSPDPRSTNLQDIQASQSLTRTYALLAVSDANLQRAAGLLGSTAPLPRELAKRISADAVRDTQLVEVSAEDTSKQRAADYANAVASALPVQIQELQKAGLPATSFLNPVVLAQTATLPTSPVRPNALLNTALGLFAGLLLSTVFALIYQHYDDRVSKQSDIDWLGVPVLGEIPRLKPSRFRRHEDNSKQAGPFAASAQTIESFRTLQANLLFTLAPQKVKVILVTSPLAEEGKTSIAVNLACVMSETGKRVLLIDGDLRRPMIHERLGLPRGAGLSSVYLTPEASPQSLAREVSPTLQVLSAGPEVPNPAQLLSSSRTGEIIASLRNSFDIILIDSAPLLDLADTILWLSYADGVILVANAGKSRLGPVTEAIEAIKSHPILLLGIVLNASKVKSRVSQYYRHR